MSRKIGIYGGAFDPPHVGHLEVARKVQDALGLDLVLFVPTGTPPHKITTTSAEHRLAMVEAAISTDLFFYTSSLEIDRTGPSYMVDTLKALKEVYPDDELYIIMGSDEANVFDKWSRPEEICRLARPVVVLRPESRIAWGGLAKTLSKKVFEVLSTSVVEGITVPVISSTDVRDNLFDGEDPRDSVWLTDGVAEYIVNNGLYCGPDKPKRVSTEILKAARIWREESPHSPSASVIMMVGLPRSGKSTIVAQLREELHAVVVSPDAVRLAVHGQRYIKEAEPWVWAVVKAMVEALVRAGNDPIILDATNMTGNRRGEWTRSDLLWDVYYYHVDTPSSVCIRRACADGQEDLVPVINKMEMEFDPLTVDELQFLLTK